jgi:hypothetical protein
MFLLHSLHRTPALSLLRLHWFTQQFCCLSICVQARLAAAEQAASNARAAATEATTRASRAAERLTHTESQLEDAQVGTGKVQW